MLKQVRQRGDGRRLRQFRTQCLESSNGAGVLVEQWIWRLGLKQ